MKVTLRIYSDDDQRCFGPGIATLLQRVREHHSLRAGAASMEMAYSKAWRIIRTAEAVFGCKLLSSTIGGRPRRRRGADAGGGAPAGGLRGLLRRRGRPTPRSDSRLPSAFYPEPPPQGSGIQNGGPLMRSAVFCRIHFLGRVGSSSVGLGMGCSLWATMVWISSTVRPRPR